MNKKLFIVSAPSGAGKTSLVNAVIKNLMHRFKIERAVTFTSRAPRQWEVGGEDYHFISEQEFETKIKEGFFIEWSSTYGTYYGSPCSIIDTLLVGSCIVILDRVGAMAIKERIPDAVLIWIAVPTLDILRQRLELRGQDTSTQIERRLALAAQEIADEEKNSLYNHTIFNEVFEESLKNFHAIIEQYLVAINQQK